MFFHALLYKILRKIPRLPSSEPWCFGFILQYFPSCQTFSICSLKIKSYIKIKLFNCHNIIKLSCWEIFETGQNGPGKYLYTAQRIWYSVGVKFNYFHKTVAFICARVTVIMRYFPFQENSQVLIKKLPNLIYLNIWTPPQHLRKRFSSRYLLATATLKSRK